MGLSVKKLQVGLLIGAGLLVLVVAGFLGYARYLANHFKLRLPGKLGVDIVQETNGFTYSQSVGGKTIYTIHAAKAVQHSNGKTTLHDVGIVLYGRKQDRADHIYGSQFEYDKAAGEIRADGAVQIDLAAAASAYHGQQEGGIRVSGPTAGESDRVIHVRTSGLVFQEKTHRAATDQQVDFAAAGLTGHSKGADYDSEDGSIVLRADVTMSGIVQDKPSVLKASHAELSPQDHLVKLRAPHYAAVSNGHGEETLSADSAIIHVDDENNPERVEAEGAVTLSASGRGTLIAQHADALLQHGHAQAAHLFGRLRYSDQETLRQATGEAQDARITFDALGRVAHISVTGDVFGQETVPNGARELHAAKVELAFAAEGKQPSVLQDALASGGARLHLTEISAAKSPAATHSDLNGDVLTAHFDRTGHTARLVSVHGAGSTVLHRVDGKGADQTSTGDLLDVSFRPQPPAQGHAGPSIQLERATQKGNVTLLRTSVAAANPKVAPAVQHGSADEAVYDDESDRVTLTGSAHLFDAASALWAQRITMDRNSGDALAEGAVRTSYLQPARPGSAAAEPVHILADRGVFQHDTETAVFYGKSARLWQGGVQVEAPVLAFDQEKRTLFAHGENTGEATVVHAVLAPQEQTKPSAAKTGHPPRRAPARIISREMTYSDLNRQVQFTGSVRVDDADGVLRAPKVDVFLQPAPQPADAPKPLSTSSKATSASKATSSPVAFPAGNIDRIVAGGGVEMQQPGRTATGDQLVYTAADQMFVLTGTKAAPPKVVDETQGTVTGDSIRFHTGDQSIVVSGDKPRRVHTETQVKQ